MDPERLGRRGAAAPAGVPADAGAREQVLDLFRASRFVAPGGNLAAAVLFVIGAWNELGRGVLVAWLGVAALISLGLQLVLSERALARLAGEHPVSRAGTFMHLLTGTLWGSVLWLDLGAADTTLLWICFTYQFAVTAGTLASHSRVVPFVQAYLVGWYAVSVAALLAASEWVLAAGVSLFFALVSRDVFVSGWMVAETIRLRVASLAHAARAEWDALHDPLTGLYNRAGLTAVAEEWCREDRRDRLTALFIDLDHFKEVNDRLGHLAGDRLLTEVAERLGQGLRTADVAARLGGDEFFVLLDEQLGIEAARGLAERLIDAIEEPFTIDGEEVYISASVGVTTVTREDATPERLLVESDHALYQAKRSGRRRAVGFSAELEAEMTARLGLETELRKTLREGTLEVWAQPVMELAGRRVLWVELLARWTRGDETVAPTHFLPLIDEIGLSEEFGRHMLEHARFAVARWRDHPVLADAAVSVNISPRHVMRGDLVSDITRLIDEGLPPGRLIVELTENEVIDHAHAHAVFGRLDHIGVRLAVDDFGAGYSSLGQMLALPVSIVKLDAGLIAGLGLDQRRTRMVAAIRELAVALGQLVMAEGVESAAQLDVLVELGFHGAQGYYLHPPMPVAELEALLAVPSEGAQSGQAEDVHVTPAGPGQ
jgi:diguanylate cyclase (GGDEF)-like protein